MLANLQVYVSWPKVYCMVNAMLKGAHQSSSAAALRPPTAFSVRQLPQHTPSIVIDYPTRSNVDRPTGSIVVDQPLAPLLTSP